MTVKINKLEIENTKRVKAVMLEPSASGLTVLGGRNNQGKSSVLDAIAWALGGNRKRPSQANREGSMSDPYLKVELSNGLIVERKGKNSDLKVTDPSGDKAGQNLLDSFVSELAIDLPKFMDSTAKEKADTLLQIIGVGDQLAQLEKEEQEKANQRLYTGQEARSKRAHANELPEYPDAPNDYIKASDLVNQQQEILARNGANQQKRNQAKQLADQFANQKYLIEQKENELARIQQELSDMKAKHTETATDLENANKTAAQLQDESTAEIEASIAEIETINDKVRTNAEKAMAEDEALRLENQYKALNQDIEDIRQSKMELLNNANLPLPGLSVVDGEITYQGQKWDNMSGSQQLIVAVSIVRKLNPECGFVLIDKLEQMDIETMQEFGQWLEQEQLQAIATRVSGGEECTIIIQDGMVVDDNPKPVAEVPTQDTNTWKGGF